MDNNTKIRMVLLIALPLGLFLFLKLCIFGYSGKKRFIKKAQENGWFTKAYLVTSQNSAGNYQPGSANRTDNIKATYEYQINGNVYRKTYHFNARSGMATAPQNYITVFYHPKNPKKVVTSADVRDGARQSGCFLSLLLTIAFILVVYNIWIRI